jgi:hypothetical protein
MHSIFCACPKLNFMAAYLSTQDHSYHPHPPQHSPVTIHTMSHHHSSPSQGHWRWRHGDYLHAGMLRTFCLCLLVCCGWMLWVLWRVNVVIGDCCEGWKLWLVIVVKGEHSMCVVYAPQANSMGPSYQGRRWGSVCVWVSALLCILSACLSTSPRLPHRMRPQSQLLSGSPSAQNTR